MLSLISLFLRFPSFFSSKFRIEKIRGLPFKVIKSSHSWATPTYHFIRCVRNWFCWRDPYYPRPILRVRCNSFRQKLLHLAFGRTHWARNFVFFSPLDCCLCSPDLYLKGQDWIWFLLLLLFSFTSLLTPHRTLVSTHKINKWAKLGSILLGVSREDDENIVSHRVSIKFWPSQEVILKFVKTIKSC